MLILKVAQSSTLCGVALRIAPGLTGFVELIFTIKIYIYREIYEVYLHAMLLTNI